MRVSEEEHGQALAAMSAPRAVRLVWREAQTQARTLGREWVFLAGAGQAGPDGALLRALCRRAGLTLEQVAVGLDVRHSTVTRWEQGRTVVLPERLAALLRLLRATPNGVFPRVSHYWAESERVLT